VIVDWTQVQGVTYEQLGDYAGMAGLADIKPNAQLGDVPTILSLFNGTPQPALAGLSDWDRAFLKSLYTTDQVSRLQRSDIADEGSRRAPPATA
jgi:hypothetical protein